MAEPTLFDGLTERKPRGRVDPEEAERLFNQGLSFNEIGRRFKVTGGAISWHLKRRGTYSPRPMPNPADPDEVVRLFLHGMTPNEIAVTLGIAHRTVCHSLRCRGYDPSPKFGLRAALSIQQAAYLAGIIDGEGSIGIDNSCPSRPRLTGQVRVRVRQSDVRLIDWLKAAVGGGAVRVNVHGPLTKHVSWEWGVTGRVATDLLAEVLPFMVVKRDQAEIALAVRELRSSPVGPERTRRCEELKCRLKATKRAHLVPLTPTSQHSPNS